MTLNLTDVKEIRKFGIMAFIFFGCLCALGIWLKKTIPTCLFGCLTLVGLGFIAIPSPLKPVYTAWLKIARLIGKVVNIVILALVYYLIVTPVAILKYIFSGRPLPVKPDKNASSYWVNRTEHAQPRERYVKRY